LPKNATEHTLYKEWKNKQEEIKEKLNAIQDKIKEAEKKENSISKKISRLFLGKKNAFSKLSQEIDELKNVDYPNLNENDLKEKIKRIDDINREVQGHTAEVEEENRKAKIDEEIEKIQKEISEQKNKLEVKEEELKKKKEEQNNKIQNFYEKYGYNNGLKLDEIKRELSIKSSNNKENMIEKQLEELQDLENTTFIQELKDDISKIETQIKNYQEQIERKEKEKNREIKSDEKTSALDELFNSSKSQANEKNLFISMPNLPQLPQTGKLYQLGEDSYLAIEFWEEYEQGKKEAERLKAKLCAIY
jgi:chromosome segregation ATPase